MWKIVGWVVAILGYAAILALIVTNGIVRKRGRRELADAIRERGIVAKICCGQVMRYESAEIRSFDGTTVRFWRFLCMRCGHATDQQKEEIEGRGPMGWMERHKADRKITERLARRGGHDEEGEGVR